MYFLRRLRPLEVAGERIRSLRVSLNAPVLSAADLPVGPARAVILVNRDSRGRMDVTVGARSLRGGEVAYWSFDGELTSDDDLDVASDAALTFAESLGFLFEESPLGSGAAADKAFRSWLAGEGSFSIASGDERVKPAPGRVEGADEVAATELVLDDLVLDEKPGTRTRAAGTVAPAPARAAPLAVVAAPVPTAPLPTKTLSKFRPREMAAAAPSAAPKAQLRQPLARMQLVKRRSPEEERRLLLRRLLTAF